MDILSDGEHQQRDDLPVGSLVLADTEVGELEEFLDPDAFSASSASRNRSRRCPQAARIAATCPASRVRGARRVTMSLTGLAGTGRPLVTWCRNGL